MTKKKFVIPYQYTIIAHAFVMADSLDEAVELLQDGAPCPTPDDMGIVENCEEINKVGFYYLEDSFEIHHDDLDLYGNPV